MKKSIVSSSLFVMMAVASMTFTSCEKGNKSECSTLTTPVTINGDNSFTATGGTHMIVGSHSMQIMAVDANCEYSHTMQVFFDEYGTSTIGDMVTAMYSVVNLLTASATVEMVETGTITVTDHGDDEFSIDVNGTLEDGDPITFSVTHQF